MRDMLENVVMLFRTPRVACTFPKDDLPSMPISRSLFERYQKADREHSRSVIDFYALCTASLLTSNARSC